PEAQRHARDAISELDRLASVVDDFMNWTAMENQLPGNLEIHAIKLDSFVSMNVQSLQGVYPKRISLSGESRTSVFGKPAHLKQVISNLIVNAAKYSPEDRP